MQDSIGREPIDRRRFMQAAAVAGAGAVALRATAARPRQPGRLRVAVIGCGGRGTGAAMNMLEASPDVEIIALADVFRDRLDGCLHELTKLEETDLKARVRIDPERCFVGLDAYRRVLALQDVEVVILATPPGFRPLHFNAAVDAGKHIFMEKPVAVDPAGVRTVLAAAEKADARRLSVVAGTQRRHERSYIESMQRLRDGAIGKIIAARCFWNQGGLWMHKRRSEWSDVEWQIRNWLYFAWLSGDHIVEQHVHNLDVVNWALDAVPIRCTAQGGRQVRTGADYGHIFDHFAVLYEYPGDVFVTSMCRQIEGCSGAVEEGFRGERGDCITSPGRAQIKPDAGSPWAFSGANPNPYVEEHRALIRSILDGSPINEARTVARSTLTAIMGRMSAYTGKPVTWDQAMTSTLDLMPPDLNAGSLAVPPVPIPGKTAFS